MNLQYMAQKLIDSGLSQDDIAEMVRKRGHHCRQNQISRVLRGHDTRYQLGDAIRQVYIDVVLRPTDREAAS
jgi:hypothetical protein